MTWTGSITTTTHHLTKPEGTIMQVMVAVVHYFTARMSFTDLSKYAAVRVFNWCRDMSFSTFDNDKPAAIEARKRTRDQVVAEGKAAIQAIKPSDLGLLKTIVWLYCDQRFGDSWNSFKQEAVAYTAETRQFTEDLEREMSGQSCKRREYRQDLTLEEEWFLMKCQYSDSCYNDLCTYNHPSGATRIGLECWYGDKCFNDQCKRNHPSDKHY